MSSKFRNGFLRVCGCKMKRKKRRLRCDSSGRKNTFHTTSSTHTSSQNNTNSDSFWSRYSHRSNSAKKAEKDKQKEDVCSIECTTIKNNNKDGNMFMKMSRKSVNDPLCKIKSIRGESFV